jgi:hypothetical protein
VPLLYREMRLGGQLAAVRAGLGLVMLARPMLVPRPLGVDRITAGRVDWLVRMAGVRDLALGAGGLAAARTGGQRSWVLAGALSDAGDALILGRAVRRGQVGRVLGSGAALSAVAAAALGLAALATPERPAKSAGASGGEPE